MEKRTNHTASRSTNHSNPNIGTMHSSENTKYLSIIFVLLFTIYDILIVEGIFRKLEAWNTIHVYHFATWNILTPCLLIICSYGFKNWKFAMYSIIGIYGGWELSLIHI